MDEFIDSYSDDILYLEQFHNILKNKKISFHPWKPIHIPVLCRFYIISLVGAVEMAVKYMMRLHDEHLYKIYTNRKIDNKIKIGTLKRALQKNNIEVDDGILSDFLALKYIRNAIIHSKWNKKDKNHVNLRKFPINVIKFNEQHLSRIQKISKKLINAQGMYYVLNNMKNL